MIKCLYLSDFSTGLKIAWGIVRDINRAEWTLNWYQYPITFEQFVTLQLSGKGHVLTWIICEDGYDLTKCNLRSNTFNGRGVLNECFVLMVGY